MHYKYFNTAFRKKVELFKNNDLFGTFRFNFWDSEVVLMLNKRRLLFKKKSIFSLDYLLYDEINQCLAEIKFEFWKQKVTILFNNFDAYIFYKTDFWGKNWQLQNNKLEKINIVKTQRFWNQEGEIISNIKDQETSDLLVGICVVILFIKMRRNSKDGN